MRAILTYHALGGEESPITIPPEAFRRHVDGLLSRGVRVLPLKDLVRPPFEGDAVALTFDDGFVSFAEHAWPCLAERRLPVTVFVVSDAVGGNNAWGGVKTAGIPIAPLLQWSELRDLARAGVTLGSHSRTHAYLPHLAEEEIEAEVAGAAERIRSETGRPPEGFAYPYGGVDSRCAAVVRRHHEVAVTTEFDSLGAGLDPVLLPRIDSWYFRDGSRLDRFGTPSFRRYLRLRRTLRRARTLLFGGHAPSRRGPIKG